MTFLQSRNQYHRRMNTLKVLTKLLVYFTLGWPEKVPERKWWGRKGKSSSEGEGRRKSQRLGRLEADLIVHQRPSWRCRGCRCAWASWCWDGGPRRGRGGAGEAFRSIGWSSWQPGCPFRGLTVYTVFMVNSQIPEDPKRVNIFLATRSKVLNGGARSKRLQLLGTEGWHRLVRRVSLSVDINNI